MPILKENLLKVVYTDLNQINLAFGSCSYFEKVGGRTAIGYCLVLMQ